MGLLYGCNTLGAVFGCVLANFVLLEAVGTRSTLWIAAGANLAVARLSAGDLPRAREALDGLQRLDPQRAAELKVLIERAGG